MWVSPAVLQAITDSFERTLAVLREENATLRRLYEAEHARGDRLLDEIARQAVQYAMPRPMPPNIPTVPRARTSRDPIGGLGNVLEPLPFGDPNGMFKSEQDAALVPNIFPTTENGEHAA